MPKRWAKSKENKSSDSNYNTQNISDLILKASTLRDENKYNEALALYDKALETDPKNAYTNIFM